MNFLLIGTLPLAIPLFQYDDIIGGWLDDCSSQRARRYLNLCSGNLRCAKTLTLDHFDIAQQGARGVLSKLQNSDHQSHCQHRCHPVVTVLVGRPGSSNWGQLG